MLSNSTRELSSIHKHLLYRTYVLSITLYSFQLYYFKEAPLYQFLKELKKMQGRVALWITEAFCTSLLWWLKLLLASSLFIFISINL